VSVLAPGTPVPQFKLSREGGSEFARDDLKGEYTVAEAAVRASIPRSRSAKLVRFGIEK
jgi:hypothetical protein